MTGDAGDVGPAGDADDSASRRARDGTPAGADASHARGRQLTAAGDYEGAGEAYTRSGYGCLGGVSSLDDGADAEGVAAALAALLRATLCYRIAGQDERATNRAGQAVLVAEDFRETVAEPALVGLSWEFVGDLRLYAGLYGVASAYDAARETYTGHADLDETTPEEWVRSPPFVANTEAFEFVVRGAGLSVDRRAFHGGDGAQGTVRMLTARIDAKRDRYPQAVETVVERGRLEVP